MVPKESGNHKSCGVTLAKHLPLSPWARSTSNARHRSKGDLARGYHGSSCRRENPKAKLFPPAGADGRAAKPSSEMFKEHKSRRRGERWHRGTAARRKYLLFKCSLIQPGRYNETARLLHRTYARERRSLPLHPRRGAGAAPGYPEDTLPGTKGWAESRCGRSCFTLNKLLHSQAGFVPRPAGTRPLRPGHSCPPTASTSLCSGLVLQIHSAASLQLLGDKDSTRPLSSPSSTLHRSLAHPQMLLQEIKPRSHSSPHRLHSSPHP